MKAEVEWDGYSWVAAPLDGGGVTQAKRLEQIPARLSEVALLMSGATVEPEAWELVIHYGELGDAAASIRARRAGLEETERELAEATRTTVKALRDEGMSLRDIGTLMGLTFQRVHQLVGTGASAASKAIDEALAVRDAKTPTEKAAKGASEQTTTRRQSHRPAARKAAR